MHPTVKPVALVADAILDCANRGGIVLDAFAGSGTTLIAAERTGRKAYALEIDRSSDRWPGSGGRPYRPCAPNGGRDAPEYRTLGVGRSPPPDPDPGPAIFRLDFPRKGSVAVGQRA